ncbi:MAG TPA: response regulator transcription factor [Intrasporangiaceae bacterium]|nr:response regulator transcription factor [Intrasporangiaceae bacterium]
MTVRVLVVDDHPVVRAGLEALLTAREEIEVVGSTEDGAQAVTLARTLRPDLVLCDLRLGPGPDGVEVTRSLLGDPGIPVLILTTYDHDRDILRAVEAGAAGYLLKDADPDDIVAAIVRAAAGDTSLDSELTERVVASMRTRQAGLSEREVEVLALVAAGRTNREIAGDLFVSEATVKTHLVHVYGKLGVDNRVSAVARARSAGLID